jgi:hypothetical protein
MVAAGVMRRLLRAHATRRSRDKGEQEMPLELTEGRIRNFITAMHIFEFERGQNKGRISVNERDTLKYHAHIVMWSPPPSADDITRYKRSALGKNDTGFQRRGDRDTEGRGMSVVPDENVAVPICWDIKEGFTTENTENHGASRRRENGASRGA